MTQREFIKEIMKEGNVILRIDFSDSNLYVNRGLVYGGIVCLNINRTAEENIAFSEYYVVKEEY